jgi:hypothetical protein
MLPKLANPPCFVAVCGGQRLVLQKLTELCRLQASPGTPGAWPPLGGGHRRRGRHRLEDIYMLPQNDLAIVGLAIVAVKVPKTGELHVRIYSRRRDGTELTIRRWECPTGRPTPAQCDEMAATLGGEFVATMVAATGVQGVLLD